MASPKLPIWEKDWACFLICIGTGVPLLLLIRLPEMLDWSSWLAAVLLSLIISAYACVIWLMRSPLSGRNERAADNLYFLGFIFTVCALGVSLYRYHAAAPDDVPVEQIMGDLGIGLMTTVVGLVSRVLVLHREDWADTEERTREQIVDFANSIMSDMYQTSEVVSQGHTANLQVMRELAKTMEQFTARVREQSHQVVLNLEEAAKSVAGFSETVNQLGSPVERMPDEIAKAVSDMQRQSIREMQGIATNFHEVIAEFLRSAQDQISASISTTEQILVSRIKQLSIPSEEVNQLRRRMLTGFDTQSQELTRSFGQFSNAMRQVTQAVDQVERDLRASTAAIANSLDSLRDGTGSFFGQARNELANLANSVSALKIDRVVDGIKEIEKISQENGRAIADQLGAASELSAKLTELIDGMRVLTETYSSEPQKQPNWWRRR